MKIFTAFPSVLKNVGALTIGTVGVLALLCVLPHAEAENANTPYGDPDEWLRDEGEMYDIVPEDEERESIRLAHRAMATEFEIIAYPRSAEESPRSLIPILEEAFLAIDRVEELFSTWRTQSQASYVNNNAAERPVPVTPEFFDLVAKVKDYWERTDGAFDITVGPLMEVWGRYEDQEAVPSSGELERIVNAIGMDKVILDEEERTIAFTSADVRLDFGGIGKGYAVDKAGEVLEEYGVDAALIHGGTSSFLAMGAPPGRDAWRVSIRHPYSPDDTIDVVELRDESLGASGSFLNLMRAGEEEVSDIVDPRTGQPVREMLTVSVVGSNGTQTDILATAFMVMGPEAIRAYCEANPGVRAIVLAKPEKGAVSPEWVNFSEKKD